MYCSINFFLLNTNFQRHRLVSIAVMKKLLIILFILFIAPYSFADEKRYTVPLLDSPVLGPVNAPVTIIEFLDYQ